VRAAVWLAALLLTACGGSRYGFDLPDDACSPATDDARPWETRAYGMVVPEDAPRRGAERPRVVIQVFSDFQCPFCARAVPTMERVVQEYGACTQVVWRQRPLRYHEHAALAARASQEVYRQAGDEAFWRFHDALFADQDRLTRADLERHAGAIDGVDMDAFGAALDGDAHQDVITRDRAAIDDLPGELELGTPSFFVNGVLLHGARRYSHFAYRIEEALSEQ